MTTNRKPCSLCAGRMEQRILPALTGNEESCRVALSNVPIMACAEGHKRLLYPAFVMELMDSLARPETAGLRVGKKRGLFRKRFPCTRCSSDIPPESTAKVEYKANLRLDDMTDSIGVAVTIPVMRCNACGNDQVADNSGLMQLFRALSRAFRSAEVRPQ